MQTNNKFKKIIPVPKKPTPTHTHNSFSYFSISQFAFNEPEMRKTKKLLLKGCKIKIKKGVEGFRVLFFFILILKGNKDA